MRILAESLCIISSLISSFLKYAKFETHKYALELIVTAAKSLALVQVLSSEHLAATADSLFMQENFNVPKNLEIQCFRLSENDWDIVPASSRREWIDATHGFASRCLPLLAANQMGYHILTPTDLSVIWDGGTTPSSVKIILEDEKYHNYIISHFGHGTFTFQLPYIFRTNQEIGLLVRGATNFWIEGAVALDGFVETHWSNYSFTMNWRIVSPNKIITIKKGDPICMLIPYPVRILENLQVEYKSLNEAPAEMLEVYEKWKAYRREFNSR
jgi:hypothetical protein